MERHLAGNILMLKKYRFLLADKLQNIVYYLIRAYSWTFRLRVENEKPWLDHLRGENKAEIFFVVHQEDICTCHNCPLPFAALFHPDVGRSAEWIPPAPAAKAYPPMPCKNIAYFLTFRNA